MSDSLGELAALASQVSKESIHHPCVLTVWEKAWCNSLPAEVNSKTEVVRMEWPLPPGEMTGGDSAELSGGSKFRAASSLWRRR